MGVTPISRARASHGVVALFTRMGMLGVSSKSGRVRHITGIPWVFINLRANWVAWGRQDPPSVPEGYMYVQWRVGLTPEDDEIKMKALDWAPMLAAWIESERTKRI